MKKEEVDILLERYYQGTSTCADEKILRDFFNSKDIPVEYEAERNIFSYYSSLSEVPEPSEHFESRIISAIDSISGGNNYSVKKLVLLVSGIAAGLMILIGTWFFLSRYETEDTFTDPELAYAETMKVLYEVSAMINSGTENLDPISKMNLKDVEGLNVLAVSRETIEESLRNLEFLQKVIRTSAEKSKNK